MHVEVLQFSVDLCHFYVNVPAAFQFLLHSRSVDQWEIADVQMAHKRNNDCGDDWSDSPSPAKTHVSSRVQRQSPLPSVKGARSRAGSVVGSPGVDPALGGISADAGQAEGFGGPQKKGRGRKSAGDDGVAKGQPKKKAKKKNPMGGVSQDEATKHHKKCRACWLWFQQISMYQDQNICIECKAWTDTLYRTCQRQNCLAWYKDIKCSEREHHKVLMRFMKASKVEHDEEARNKVLMAELFNVKQTVKSTDAVSEGVMMWEGQFFNWSRTDEAGNLNYDDAKRLWAELNADPDKVVDAKGPKQSPHRVRVPTKDRIDFRKSEISMKEHRSLVKRDKNASMEDVRLGRRSTEIGHDTMIDEQEQIRIAQDAVNDLSGTIASDVPDCRSMRNQVFAKVRGNSVNVRGLASDRYSKVHPDDKSDLDTDADGGSVRSSGMSACGDGSSTGVSPGKALSKKAKWFDVGKQIGQHRTSFRSTIAEMRKEYPFLMETMSASIAGHEANPIFADLVGLCKARRKALAAVFHETDQDAVVNYLDAFKAACDERQAGESNLMSYDTLPPCASYSKLIHIQEFENNAMTALTEDVQDSEYLQQIVLELASEKQPILELLAACRDAVADIAKESKKQKRKDDVKAEKQKKDQSNVVGAPDDEADDVAVVPQSIFSVAESAAPHCRIEILRTYIGTIPPEHDMMYPARIAAPASCERWMKPGNSFRNQIELIKLSFKDSHARSGRSRGHKLVRNQVVADSIVEALLQVVPKNISDNLTDRSAQLSECLTPGMWVLSPDASVVWFMESNGLGSLQYQAIGTRAVVIVPVKDIIGFASEINFAPGADLSAENVRACAETMLVEKISEYSGILWKGTLGPGEILYTPPATIVAEIALNSSLAAGGRMSLLPQPGMCAALQKFKAALELDQGNVAVLDEVVAGVSAMLPVPEVSPVVPESAPAPASAPVAASVQSDDSCGQLLESVIKPDQGLADGIVDLKKHLAKIDFFEYEIDGQGDAGKKKVKRQVPSLLDVLDHEHKSSSDIESWMAVRDGSKSPFVGSVWWYSSSAIEGSEPAAILSNMRKEDVRLGYVVGSRTDASSSKIIVAVVDCYSPDSAVEVFGNMFLEEALAVCEPSECLDYILGAGGFDSANALLAQ